VVTAYPTADTRVRRMAITDDEGRFSLTMLPCSNVVVLASKAGYVTSYFGATVPGATTGVAVALSDRNPTAEVPIEIHRGAVLTGVVTDDTGRPAPGVAVRVRQAVTLSTGERTLSIGSPAGPAPVTDDRGRYRAFGLPPGEYTVSVQQPRALGGAAELRETTVAELRWAEAQIKAGTKASPAAAAPARGRAVMPAVVHYPSTVDESSATLVKLAAGQELDGIDIAMQLVPTARLEGRVIDAGGQPAAGVVITLLSQSGDAADMARAAELAAVGLGDGAASATSRADGGFVLPVVQPGRYVVTARHAPPSQPAAWARAELVVTGSDMSDLVLQLTPGITVSGRVVFGGISAPASAVRMGLRPTGADGTTATATVNASGPDTRFSIPGVMPGSYRLTATALPWTIKSAMLAGADVADAVFVVGAGSAPDVVVTFTDAAAEVSGVLYDSEKRPASDLFVILFTTDRSLWFQGSRRLKAPARPATDGRYRFAGVPPGEYYLAALTESAAGEWFSPRFLDAVVPSALKVVVADGEKKVQDIAVGAGGSEWPDRK
jgi:protocatechuate 3,4-dioxygenase beta subunit